MRCPFLPQPWQWLGFSSAAGICRYMGALFVCFKGSYFSLEFVCKYLFEGFYKKYCQTEREMVGFEITEEILTQGASVCSVVLTGGERPQHPNRKDLEGQF